MWLIILVIAAILVPLIGFFIFLSMGSAEAKVIKEALAKEKESLGKLGYDALEKLIKDKPETEVPYGGALFLRKLSMGVADHGDYKDMQVRLALSGTKAKDLVDYVTFVKRKELEK